MLDTDIEELQLGHIGDHDDIATRLNALETALALPGDVLIAIASGQIDRLPVGADGSVLTADSTAPKKLRWSSISSSPEPGLYVPSQFAGTGAAQLNAMIDGAFQDDGGVAMAPATTIDEPLLGKPGVELRGYGQERSQLTMAPGLDLGTDVFALDYDPDPALGFGFGTTFAISNLLVQGPGGSLTPALGSRNIAMGGIRLPSHAVVRNVTTRYFGVGLAHGADHNILDHVYLQYNWDGRLTPDLIPAIGGPATGYATSGGDHLIIGGGMTQNRHAAWVNEGSATSFNDLVLNSKIGYGPICFLRTDMKDGALASVVWMANVIMLGMTNENFGNFVLCDLSSASSGSGAVSMIACQFLNAHGLSNGDTSKFRDASLSHDVTCKVKAMRGNRFKASHLPWAVQMEDVVGGVIVPGTAGSHIWDLTHTLQVSNIDDRPYFNQAATIPLGAGQYMRGVGTTGWNVITGNGTSETHPATGTILRNDLVEYTGTSGVKRLTTAGHFAGTAAGDANNADTCVVSLAGERTVAVNCEGAVLAGQLLYPVSTREYHASVVVNGTPIGLAMTGGGLVGGTAIAYVATRP